MRQRENFSFTVSYTCVPFPDPGGPKSTALIPLEERSGTGFGSSLKKSAMSPIFYSIEFREIVNVGVSQQSIGMYKRLTNNFYGKENPKFNQSPKILMNLQIFRSKLLLT